MDGSGSRDKVAAKRLAGRVSRRAALRGLGGGGIAAGLVGAAALGRTIQAEGTATPTGQRGEGLPPFNFALEASAGHQYTGGIVRSVTSVNLPSLRGMSLYSERIDAGAIRELHWHANADELGYCLAGTGEMGILSPDGTMETFAILADSVSFVPEGYAHYIRNTGSDPLHLVIGFNHEKPATFDYSLSLPIVPRAFLAETFGVATSAFPALQQRGDGFLVPLNGGPAAPPARSGPGLPARSFTVNLDQVVPAQFGGGQIYTLGPTEIAELDYITVWPVHANPRALREPHWHPNAPELNYCIRGSAQIGLVAPDGKQETFVVQPGDIGFIPTNWFHYIASVSDEPLDLLVFFGAAEPQHIDLSQTVGAFPSAIIAASFGLDPQAFAHLPNRGDVLLAGAVSGGGSGTPTA